MFQHLCAARNPLQPRPNVRVTYFFFLFCLFSFPVFSLVFIVEMWYPIPVQLSSDENLKCLYNKKLKKSQINSEEIPQTQSPGGPGVQTVEHYFRSIWSILCNVWKILTFLWYFIYPNLDLRNSTSLNVEEQWKMSNMKLKLVSPLFLFWYIFLNVLFLLNFYCQIPRLYEFSELSK